MRHWAPKRRHFCWELPRLYGDVYDAACFDDAEMRGEHLSAVSLHGALSEQAAASARPITDRPESLR